jgi:hypothetical protein
MRRPRRYCARLDRSSRRWVPEGLEGRAPEQRRSRTPAGDVVPAPPIGESSWGFAPHLLVFCLGCEFETQWMESGFSMGGGERGTCAYPGVLPIRQSVIAEWPVQNSDLEAGTGLRRELYPVTGVRALPGGTIHESLDACRVEMSSEIRTEVHAHFRRLRLHFKTSMRHLQIADSPGRPTCLPSASLAPSAAATPVRRPASDKMACGGAKQTALARDAPDDQGG